MDYSKELLKIQDFVRSEYYRDAARNCGAILEAVLRDIYGKVRAKAPPAASMKLLEVEGRLAKGSGGFQTFMLGQLVGLFREGRVFDHAESALGVSCRLSRRLPLAELNEIRNRCTHDHEHTPTLEELNFFLSNLRVLLSEFGYLSGDISLAPEQSPEERLKEELSEIRMQMLSGGTARDLRESLYKLENILHRHPSHPEALSLKAQLSRAARYEEMTRWPAAPHEGVFMSRSMSGSVRTARRRRAFVLAFVAAGVALAVLLLVAYLVFRSAG
jgi:hypothetical protein